MTEERETIAINEAEYKFIEIFRVALSERSHPERLKAIGMVRHDVTANRLARLFSSQEYILGAGPKDYEFLKWAAETASVRHESMVDLMEVDQRFQGSNQRKLNIAEHIGRSVVHSIQQGEFRGVQVKGGILDLVREEAKKESVYGGRDKDTLREIWKTYRGVVHLGMAITYLEENPTQLWHVLELADFFRGMLGEKCPKGTKSLMCLHQSN